MTDQTATTETPRTKTPASAEAPKDQPTSRTLTSVIGKRNPDNDAILEEIRDQEVTIAAVEIEVRQGKRRKYKVTTVTLDDGRSFTVVGGGVATPLGYLEPEDFPIGAVFYLEPSAYGEGEYYWSVK